MTFWLTQESGQVDLLVKSGGGGGEILYWGNNIRHSNQLPTCFGQYDESDRSKSVMKTVEDRFRERFSLDPNQYVGQVLSGHQIKHLLLSCQWKPNAKTLTVRLEGYLLKTLQELFGNEVEVRVVLSGIEIFYEERKVQDTPATPENSSSTTKGMKIGHTTPTLSVGQSAYGMHYMYPQMQIYNAVDVGAAGSSFRLTGTGDSYANFGFCEDANVKLPVPEEYQDSLKTLGTSDLFRLMATARVEVSLCGFHTPIFPCGGASGMTTRLTKKILEEGIHTDVKIVTNDGKELLAHKSFLSAQSPVFGAMLRNDCKESLTHTIEVPEMSEEGVKALLAFLYHGDLTEAEKNSEIAFDLFEAGHKYEVPALEECAKQILVRKPIDWIDLGVALRVFMFTGKMEGCEDLKARSLEIMKRRFEELKETEEYQELFLKDPAGAMDLCAQAFAM